MPGDKQRFEVAVLNCSTGETWVTWTEAASPEDALAGVLRRKLFAGFLLSEGRFEFLVDDDRERMNARLDRARAVQKDLRDALVVLRAVA